MCNSSSSYCHMQLRCTGNSLSSYHSSVVQFVVVLFPTRAGYCCSTDVSEKVLFFHGVCSKFSSRFPHSTQRFWHFLRLERFVTNFPPPTVRRKLLPAAGAGGKWGSIPGIRTQWFCRVVSRRNHWAPIAGGDNAPYFQSCWWPVILSFVLKLPTNKVIR